MIANSYIQQRENNWSSYGQRALTCVKNSSLNERIAALGLGVLAYYHPVASLCGLSLFAVCKYEQWTKQTAKLISYPRVPVFFDPTHAPDRAAVRNPNFPTLLGSLPESTPASLPNGGNTCFFASLTQAFLGGDDRILEAVGIAMDRAKGKDKEALTILYEYLLTYHVRQRTAAPMKGEETAMVRKALSLLTERDGRLPNVESATQQDPDEVAGVILGAILHYLPAEEHLRLFPQTRLLTLGVLDAPTFLPREALNPNDPSVIDPNRKIYWEPPQDNWGRIDLPLDFEIKNRILGFPYGDKPIPSPVIRESATLSSALRNFFFEDKSRESNESRMIRRQNEAGEVSPFYIRSKRTCFETSPERLCITLKRFCSNGRKIVGSMRGIAEELELPGDYFLDGSGARYRLEGAILHAGETSGSGHYTAFRRTVDDRGVHHYFYTNDSVIRAISQTEFREGIDMGKGEKLGVKDAYMIFFRKIV